jgi:uncharacterized protein YdhG (YjbR/CyaY superfamily)
MARTDFRSVNDYIASQPEAVQRLLTRVRGIIRKALPAAEEVISYRIPTYTLHGRPVVYFAGWARHYSLYPLTDRVTAAFKDDLARYDVSKGTVRFPLTGPVPATLIEGIAKLRAKEVEGEQKARAAAKKR